MSAAASRAVHLAADGAGDGWAPACGTAGALHVTLDVRDVTCDRGRCGEARRFAAAARLAGTLPRGDDDE